MENWILRKNAKKVLKLTVPLVVEKCTITQDPRGACFKARLVGRLPIPSGLRWVNHIYFTNITTVQSWHVVDLCKQYKYKGFTMVRLVKRLALKNPTMKQDIIFPIQIRLH